MSDTKRSQKQATVIEKNVGEIGRDAVIQLFYAEENPERLPGRFYGTPCWAVHPDDEHEARAKLGQVVTIGISSPPSELARLVPTSADALPTDGDRYDAGGLAEQGMHAFWARVAEVCRREYPEITTGDLPPDADLALGKACELAVIAWIAANAPRTASTVAALRVQVVMRGPERGERGWWVAADNAKDALAEVLKESEELGFIADREYATGERDEHGMRPVTIEIGQAGPRAAWKHLKDLP